MNLKITGTGQNESVQQASSLDAKKQICCAAHCVGASQELAVQLFENLGGDQTRSRLKNLLGFKTASARTVFQRQATALALARAAVVVGLTQAEFRDSSVLLTAKQVLKIEDAFSVLSPHVMWRARAQSLIYSRDLIRQATQAAYDLSRQVKDKRAIVDNRHQPFELLDKLSAEDVKDIVAQHGHDVLPQKFIDRVNAEGPQLWQIGQGAFGEVGFARNLATGQIGVVKSLSVPNAAKYSKTIRFNNDLKGDAAHRNLNQVLQQFKEDNSKGLVAARAEVLINQQFEKSVQAKSKRFHSQFVGVRGFAAFFNGSAMSLLSTHRLPTSVSSSHKGVSKAYLFSDFSNAGDLKSWLNKQFEGEHADLRSDSDPDRQAMQLKRDQAIFDVSRQLLLAAGTLHISDFTHRDIKLDNVLIEQQANGKLHARFADLGLMQSAEKHTDFLGGTKKYFPPEVRSKTHQALFTDNRMYDGQKHDSFSLGKVLLELRQKQLGVSDVSNVRLNLLKNDGDTVQVKPRHYLQHDASGVPIDSIFSGFESKKLKNLNMSSLDCVIACLMNENPVERLSLGEAAKLVARLTPPDMDAIRSEF